MPDNILNLDNGGGSLVDLDGATTALSGDQKTLTLTLTPGDRIALNGETVSTPQLDIDTDVVADNGGNSGQADLTGQTLTVGGTFPDAISR